MLPPLTVVDPAFILNTNSVGTRINYDLALAKPAEPRFSPGTAYTPPSTWVIPPIKIVTINPPNQGVITYDITDYTTVILGATLLGFGLYRLYLAFPLALGGLVFA